MKRRASAPGKKSRLTAPELRMPGHLDSAGTSGERETGWGGGKG